MKRKLVLITVVFILGLTGCGKVDEVSQKVSDDIDSIGEVTLDDERRITDIEEIYSTLTDKQKNQVENYKQLLDARDELNNLLSMKEQEKEEILSIQRQFYDNIDVAIEYLKSKAKNPSSLNVSEIIVTSKPMAFSQPLTIYIKYTAQNGFGNDVKGVFLYWYEEGVGTDADEFYDTAKKIVEGNSKSVHNKIADNFYSTVTKDDIDIGESYFLVDLDDYNNN